MAQTRASISTPSEVSITRMTEHDLLEIVEIEETCGLSPWGWDSYHRELNSGANAIMLVATIEHSKRVLAEGKRTAGFIVARVIVNELHINNIAVRPAFQQMGIGAQLLNAALAEGISQGSVMSFLEVRASNSAAQNLYERCGFRIVGRRNDYYREPLEDALIMSLLLKSLP